MSNTKTISEYALGITVLIALIVMPVIFLIGIARISAIAFPIIDDICSIVFLVCIFILLPLCILRSTRSIAATGFLIASYIFGLDIWFFGFLVTYALWGMGAVVIGMLFMGIGVVPLGMLAAAFHGLWWPQFGYLFLGSVLTFGTRIFSMYLIYKTTGQNSSSTNELPVIDGVYEKADNGTKAEAINKKGTLKTWYLSKAIWFDKNYAKWVLIIIIIYIIAILLFKQ